MTDYKDIAIDISENGGYIITTEDNKKYVFSDIETLISWVKDNLSATGEVERFSEALDDEPKASEYIYGPYNIPVNYSASSASV